MTGTRQDYPSCLTNPSVSILPHPERANPILGSGSKPAAPIPAANAGLSTDPRKPWFTQKADSV